MKDVTLELGGKNALIAFPDADPDEVAAGAVAGMNFARSAGQSCGSTSRLLLHESIADDVLDRVAARMSAIRIGSPLDPATEMGTCRHPRPVRQDAELHRDRPRRGRAAAGRRRPPAGPGSTAPGCSWRPPSSAASGRTCGSRARRCSARCWPPSPGRDEDEAIQHRQRGRLRPDRERVDQRHHRAHRVASALEAGYSGSTDRRGISPGFRSAGSSCPASGARKASTNCSATPSSRPSTSCSADGRLVEAGR